MTKKECDAFNRRSAKAIAGPSAKKAGCRHKAIAILEKWESSPASIPNAQWDALQADIAANRFRLRVIK